MLDTLTLRVAFGVVAVTLLVLFYAVTYRTTRSVYCGWWCLSLAMFLAGSCAYLLDGTGQQWWANPTGNVLIVGGGVCVWAGARSLRAARPPWWQLILGPVVVAVASGFDHPSTNTWSGGFAFLLLVSLSTGLASSELWREQRDPASDVYTTVVRSMAIVSAVFSVFYLARGVVFFAVGPDAVPFTTVFGSQVTTLLTMVLLATVSVSMSSLSHEQQTGELQARADRDALTGLLNRAAFMQLARVEARKVVKGTKPAAVVLADLDHFKAINDTHGHAAGDHAVVMFAETCRDAIRTTDLVGRLGGDEFVLLLPGATPRRAREVARDISARLKTAGTDSGANLPTVSWGIAALDDSGDLEAAVARADAALYAAKAAGRDRAMLDPIHTEDQLPDRALG